MIFFEHDMQVNFHLKSTAHR